ncbi:MAG TPA: alpha-amylase family glycosyl hydrolase [Solirubrobacteraceae bacterium]|nr:alpha-amylase family glycosyl hydrolase [Solirubrobacteraceae bacterium]
MWWHDGVLYQCYPRSFADSDGDGVGDLPGIRARLDHLQWLGIDGLWLNPTFPSPNADWGFDVSDYRGVHPELGTLDDLDALVADARSRGIRVLLDLVPNHTSDEHPWFADSRSARDSARRDWYVWRDPAPDGGPPNNWVSIFGGPAWTLDERTGQYYLHNFKDRQPDLDWWNDAVRDEFDDILRWWFDRGIAGFRIDVAHGIVKDRELRDNPPPGDADKHLHHWLGQRPAFSMNREDVHDVYRRWRALCDARPGGPEDRPILVGETWVDELERLVTFYGSGTDELHLAFNFVFIESRFDPARLAGIVARTEELLPGEAWPTWTLGNHDVERFPTRWCDEDPARSRCALLLLLTLRGTPVLYYGDELALPDTPLPSHAEVDPVALLRDPDRPGRDPARTPMPWSAAPGAGFTRPGVEPWLPLGDVAAANVEDQRADRGSPLHLVRDLIALRRAHADLRAGAYRELPAPPGAWAYRRGERATVALNLGRDEVAVDGVRGTIAACTDRSRDGEAVGGALCLAPSQGAVVLG